MTRIAIALGVLLSFAPLAHAGAPPDDPIAIEILTLNGSGCLPGSVVVQISPDNTWFDVGYSGNFTAAVGIGTRPTDLRKNCQLLLLPHIPPGYSYAIASIDHHAFVSLAPGATGTHRAHFFYSGAAAPPIVSHPFSGPREGPWQVTDAFDESSLLFSPCGTQRALTINAELRVSVGTSDPTQSTSSLSMMWPGVASDPTRYHLVWRQCE